MNKNTTLFLKIRNKYAEWFFHLLASYSNYEVKGKNGFVQISVHVVCTYLGNENKNGLVISHFTFRDSRYMYVGQKL